MLLKCCKSINTWKKTNLCDWVWFQEKTKKKRVFSSTLASKLGSQTLFQFLPNFGNWAWFHLSFKYPQLEFLLLTQQIRMFGQHWIHPWQAWDLSYYMMPNLMYLKIVNFDQEKCNTWEQKFILVICTTITWHCYLEEIRSVFFSNNFFSFFLKKFGNFCFSIVNSTIIEEFLAKLYIKNSGKKNQW
jgi:hypothetical protein